MFIILADLPNNLLRDDKEDNNYKGISYMIGVYKKNLIAGIDYQTLSASQVDCFSLLYDAYLNYKKYFVLKLFYYEIFYDSLIRDKRGRGGNLKLSINEISGIDMA